MDLLVGLEAARPGGRSLRRWGVPVHWYPEAQRQDFTEQDARTLLYRDCWEATGCDFWPSWLGLMVFDAAVEHGAADARKLLQRALDLTPTGQITDETFEAGVRAAPPVLGRLLELRLTAYQPEGEIAPGPGAARVWMRHLLAVTRACLGEMTELLHPEGGHS